MKVKRTLLVSALVGDAWLTVAFKGGGLWKMGWKWHWWGGMDGDDVVGGGSHGERWLEMSKEGHEVYLKLDLELQKEEKLLSSFISVNFGYKEYISSGMLLIALIFMWTQARLKQRRIGKDPKTPSEIWLFMRLAALYGRKCRTPVLWAEISESSLIGPELVQETTNKVVLIKEKLKAARDRQKSYANNRCKSLEFKVGDRVLLKVVPWKGVIHFGKKGKLAPSVHDTFHVSNLKKCLADDNLHVSLDEIKIDKTLSFVEKPIEIMDREVRSLKRSKISLVKFRWNLKCGPEFTWEREDHMKFKYHQLFVDRAIKSAS
ncbi:hypothetical protein Tco_0634819 [Tanacetum coccineum]